MLNVFERSVLRRIFGPEIDEVTGERRLRHNVDLMALADIPPLSCFIRAQRLRWAGHVARAPDDSLIKMVLLGRPDGVRPLGRPRTRWADNIRRDLLILGEDPDEWMQIAEDRRRWRRLVLAAMDHRGLAPLE